MCIVDRVTSVTELPRVESNKDTRDEMKCVLFFLLALSLSCLATFSNQPVYNNYDYLFVVGQDENLTSSALTNSAAAINNMMSLRGWSFEQVVALYTAATEWYCSQFGVCFDPIGTGGATSAPYFALSKNGNAFINPLTAIGKYHVIAKYDPQLVVQVAQLPQYPPKIELVEFVALFNMTPVYGPGWQFVPFNYTGVYGPTTDTPQARIDDNLAFGRYTISFPRLSGADKVLEVDMRVPVPDRTEPRGRSVERAELCNSFLGAGNSVMHVESFAVDPNSQGKYPTSSVAVWHFYSKNRITNSATPNLYGWVPQSSASNACIPTLVQKNTWIKDC